MDLRERLRVNGSPPGTQRTTGQEAADYIDALLAENTRFRDALEDIMCWRDDAARRAPESCWKVRLSAPTAIAKIIIGGGVIAAFGLSEALLVEVTAAHFLGLVVALSAGYAMCVITRR